MTDVVDTIAVTNTIPTEKKTTEEVPVSEVQESTEVSEVTAPVAEEEITTEVTEEVTEVEEEAKDVVETKSDEDEVAEISGGILHKKGPYVPFLASPRYFYFREEPYELSKLKIVFRKHGKGDEIFRAIAHATHTGKGLLFYTTTSEHIDEPHGIIILNQITSITKTANTKSHHFKIVTKHHTWEVTASTHLDFRSWKKTIEKKRDETKSLTSEVEESEVYKATMEQLVKKTAFAILSPQLSPVEKDTEGTSALTGGNISNEPESDPAAEAVVKTEESSKITKRRSIFVSPFTGRFKKENVEHPIPSIEASADIPSTEAAAEPSTQETEVTTTEVVAEEVILKVESEEVKTDEVKVTTEEVETKEVETKVVETKVESPTADKRKSYFPNFGFLSKKPTTPLPAPIAEPKIEETTAAVDVQVTEESVAVAETDEANVGATGAVKPVEEATETVTDVQVTEVVEVSETVTSGESSAPKRKLFTLFTKKPEEKKSEEEAKPDNIEAPSTEVPAEVSEEVEVEKKKEEEKKEEKKEKGLIRRITNTFGKKPKATAVAVPAVETLAESSVEKSEETKVVEELKGTELEVTTEEIKEGEEVVETTTTEEVTVTKDGEEVTTVTTTVTKEVTEVVDTPAAKEAN